MTTTGTNLELQIIDALLAAGPERAGAEMGAILRRVAPNDIQAWPKFVLLKAFDAAYGESSEQAWLRPLLRKRPIRSLSGITSVTVLTKPFPCPGRCVFCPVDVRMPKSYIASEPGAQRAGNLGFDPYQQVTTRLRSYTNNGHPISKIELIVLGGSWSSYPVEYQRWFIKRLFDALNDFGSTESGEDSSYPTDWADRIDSSETYNTHINNSQYVTEAREESASVDELVAAQNQNESADIRCVGLSLETRPDLLDDDECVRLRTLGATKIQIGIQSLDETVLKLNKRGHKVSQTRAAIEMLRRYGFKIQAHWMPNLYGSSPDADIEDFAKVFDDPSIKPDELKVYPTALIQDTELEALANEGKWHAYEPDELSRVLRFVLTNTPQYCRLSRIIRDIPSFEILAGNKKGNLRQIVEQGVDEPMVDIRAREIRDEHIDDADLEMSTVTYDTAQSQEQFIQFTRASDNRLAGFARLSLPKTDAPLEELTNAAIIREVHVYGQSVDVGFATPGAQHRGLGRQLVEAACTQATQAGFSAVAVISAVGTRAYYERLGFTRAGLYQRRAVPTR